MRIIEVIADPGHLDTLLSIAEQHEVTDAWFHAPAEGERCVLRMLVSDDSRQAVIDALQNVLATSEDAHVIIQPVEAVLPRREEKAEDGKARKAGVSQTREELYNRIQRDARLDNTFMLLVCLSTVVACIGLIEDNLAVIIGAMVIAPLLGPNIALAFAASLGDSELTWQALKTNLAGVGLTLTMSVIAGIIWQGSLHSSEIMARTDVGLAGVVLALASGAAAVLSLITGLSSALVGVMVAVALLPPAATLGIMLGSGEPSAALGAGLLLAVNVVCINLSARLMFMFKGVRPRTWLEKTRARQSVLIYMTFWILSLLILLAAIIMRHGFYS